MNLKEQASKSIVICNILDAKSKIESIKDINAATMCEAAAMGQQPPEQLLELYKLTEELNECISNTFMELLEIKESETPIRFERTIALLEEININGKQRTLNEIIAIKMSTEEELVQEEEE